MKIMGSTTVLAIFTLLVTEAFCRAAWPQTGHDAAHTYWAQTSGPSLLGFPYVAWQSANAATYTTVIGSNSVAYGTSKVGNTYVALAFSLANDTVFWTKNFVQSLGPIAYDETLDLLLLATYSSSNTSIVGLRAANGEQEWSVALPYIASSIAVTSNHTAVVTTQLIVDFSVQAVAVYAIDCAGTPAVQRWSFDGTAMFNATSVGFAAASGTVFAAFMPPSGPNAFVVALDEFTGDVRWTKHLVTNYGAGGSLGVVVRPDGRVWLQGPPSFLLEPATGDITNPTFVAYAMSGAVLPDSSMLAADEFGGRLRLYAAMATNMSQPLWTLHFNTCIVDQPITDGVVAYLGLYPMNAAAPCAYSKLAINVSSGEILWNMSGTGSGISMSFLLGDDGSVYGLVYANNTIVRLGCCSGQGICHPGRCECNATRFGDDCSIECSEATCSHHGTCSPAGECVCTADYYGPTCSTYCDSVSNCTGHGHCSTTGTCLCDDTFVGPQCAVMCSPESNCTSHGACLDDGSCVCDFQYFGAHCDSFCSSNKTSTDGVCECPEKYFGANCTIYCESNIFVDGQCLPCDDQKTCSDNGKCKADGTCDCNSQRGFHYEGNDCSKMVLEPWVVGVLIGVGALILVITVAIAIYCIRRRRRHYDELG